MSGTTVTRGQAIYALVIIFLANFINYVDRFLVSALLPSIKETLDLSPNEKNLLWTAFTIGYMVTAPVIGYVSDRYRRTFIFGFCILLWSLATIGSGMAGSFSVLIFMRVLTGIGEAGCLIVGPTLIADYFPRAVRGKMLAVFYLGMPLGGTAGYLIAGEFSDWRNAFYYAGAPGLLIALLVALLKEPVRGASEGQEGHTSHSIKFTNLHAYWGLFKTRTLLYVTLAQAAAVFTFIPLAHNGTDYLQSVRKMELTDATRTFGLLFLLGGMSGNFIGGFLGDRWVKTNKAAYSLIPGISILLGFPCLLTAVLVQEKWIYTASLFACVVLFFTCMPAFNTQIANVIHPSQRAMAYAVVVFGVHILGDTLSPIIFGAIEKSYGMQVGFEYFTVMLLLSSFFCFLASRHASRDTEKVNPPS